MPATITNATAEWTQAVESKTATGMSTPQAIRAVVQSRPDLHRAYLIEVNQNAGRHDAVLRLQGR